MANKTHKHKTNVSIDYIRIFIFFLIENVHSDLYSYYEIYLSLIRQYILIVFSFVVTVCGAMSKDDT